MRRKYAFIIVIIVSLLFLGLSSFFIGKTALSATGYAATTALTAIATPTLIPRATPTSSVTGNPTSIFDPAIIGLLGVVLGSIITGMIGFFIAYYQAKRQHEQQREQQKEQEEENEKLRNDIANMVREYQQRQMDWEKERRLLRAVGENRTDTTTLEQLRKDAFSQEDIHERAKLYRQGIQHDPRLSQLQILGMPRPLHIMHFHVPMRLDQRIDKLDDSLLEPIRDPHILIRREITFLERHARTAITPAEAVRRHKRCVLVGDPGAGKTTLLKYLALKSALGELDELPDLPIFIELNVFAISRYQDLLDFAANQWDRYYGFKKNDARGYMEDMLQQGKAFLLLDALDEAVIGSNDEEAETSYHRVAETIRQAATRYHQSPIVVTARKLGYRQRGSLEGFAEFELQAFRREDIKQFIEKWFDSSPDTETQVSASDLSRKLENTPHLQTLATNPLLLSLIVRLYERQIELPERRARLYKECVDLLLRDWDAQRHRRRYHDLEQRHTEQLLEQIAWHFHDKGLRYFKEEELLQKIADFLPTVQLPAERNGRVLDAIISENGLLKEQALRIYSFFHLTFQEYFVAQHISKNQDLSQLLRHRGDSWWEEICFLYAGHIPDASTLLQILMGQDETIRLREDIFHTNLILAGGCLVAHPTTKEISLWEQIISQLEQILLQTPYALTRDRIVQTLVAIGTDKVLERLLDTLANEQLSRELRINIAQALGTQRKPAVIDRLKRLFNDPQIDSHVRGSIIQALGMLGEHSMMPRLLAMLQDSSPALDWHVREGIVQSLGILGGASTSYDLLHLLQDRQLASYIRSRIAQVLGILGDRSVSRILLRFLSEQQVNPSFSSDENSVLINIVQALGDIGDPSVIPELLELLQNRHIDLTIRKHIARVLGILGMHDRSIVLKLQTLLNNTEFDILTRCSIVYALALLGTRSAAVPELLSLLKKHIFDQDVASTIIQTLEQFRDLAAIPDLLTLLQTERLDPYVQSCIVQTLGILGDSQVLPNFLCLLSKQQTNKLVRIKVAQSLQHFAPIITLDAIKDLVGQLDTSDVASDIHHSLWIISRQRSIRIFVMDEQGERQVRIIKLPKDK
ncbi:MAG TPA: HEAT repeat domain-containing protein [Ktedonobacteraceae bacterium]|nr:HEAT repeat domain-containing protein [Ktedonobacteraceae bacterium]